MNKIKRIFTERPILGSIFAILSVLLGAALLHQVVSMILPSLGKEPSAVLMVAMRVVMAIAIIAWLGWWKDVGLTAPRLWRNKRLLLLLVPLPLIPLMDGINAGDATHVLFLGTAALMIAYNVFLGAIGLYILLNKKSSLIPLQQRFK